MQPTALFKNGLFRRLLSLGLDPRHFVVFGSGPLLAHGIRTDVGDLDVVARGPAWERASQIGIPGEAPVTGDRAMRFWGGRIEVFRGWISPEWDTDKLIDQADIVGGVRFARLDQVLAYKRTLRREKDIADILSIEIVLERRRLTSGERVPA